MPEIPYLGSITLRFRGSARLRAGIGSHGFCNRWHLYELLAFYDPK